MTRYSFIRFRLRLPRAHGLEQLLDHIGRWFKAIVPHIGTRIAHIKTLTRRHDGLEEREAIVVAPTAIPGSRLSRHLIEAVMVLASGEVAGVRPNQTDQFRGETTTGGKS